jgi:hypothetical protein
METAIASKDLSEVPQAGVEMVNTCFQLGLSEVDRVGGTIAGIVREQAGGVEETTFYPPAKVLVSHQELLVQSKTVNSSAPSRSLLRPTSFRFSLPPGDYQVSAQIAHATCQPVSVTVRSSTTATPLVVTCGSDFPIG